jgi:hypothetical protein
MNKPQNTPLRCRVVGRVLTIEIGVDTLKGAAERAECFWRPVTDKSGLVVSNALQFARDVRTALNDEEEDGTTRIHRMFDAAFEYVAENGSEAMDLDAMEAIEDAERAAARGDDPTGGSSD